MTSFEPAHSSVTKTLRTIVVATDFSEGASIALRWASRLARHHDATVLVVHSVPVEDAAAITLEQQERIARSLASVETVLRRDGVRAAWETRFGRPWEQVVEFAREREADLLVVGARGHTAYTRLRLGSTADRILRASTVPVLTVHDGDHPTPPDTPIRTVLVATDFSKEATDAAAVAANLFAPKASGALRLILLHAWVPLTDYDFAMVGTSMPSPPDNGDEIARAALADTAAALSTIDGADVEIRVAAGYPATVIEREAETVQADLIALGTHGRSGLGHLLMGSIAERVVRHAPCPVLTVRHVSVPQAARPPASTTVTHG